MANYGTLDPIDEETGNVNVVIETPRGSRNKYKFDEDNKIFKLSKSLPAGSMFPFDFGFIPSTLAPDGDPLDILVLMDAPVFVGCLLEVRLLGVIEAQQKPKGEKWRRNDRVIGVFHKAENFDHCKSLRDLNPNLLKQIEHFFIAYHVISGNIFKPIKRGGVAAVSKILRESMRRFADK